MCQVFAGQDPERYATQARSMRLNGQSTSIRLENAFWEIIDEIARRDNVSTPTFISTLHSEVLELRGEPTNFTSLLRCACLKFIEINPGISVSEMLPKAFEDAKPEKKLQVV